MLPLLSDYTKWRDTYNGGPYFVDRYLRKFSSRETAENFADRKTISYCPNIIKKLINKLRDNVARQLIYVKREGGDASYSNAVEYNVDLQYNSMNNFISTKIMPDLLFMSKVGIYVDMPKLNDTTLYSSKRPYIYTYDVEQIGEYVYGENLDLIHLQLSLEDDTLIFDLEDRQVKVTSKNGSYYLSIPKIPFVIADIKNSLIEDVCDFQIALLNLESSDLTYSLLSNFPFYTEQYDPLAQSQYLKTQAGPNNENTEKNVEAGTSHGRGYPLGTERPQFISPSSEPLKASMEKQNQIKEQIRELLDDSVDDLGSGQGLTYVASVLKAVEIKIAEYWHLYLGKPNTVKISYPISFEKWSFEQKKEEIKELKEIMFQVPSKTFQKGVSRKIADLTLGHCVTYNEMETIYSEINDADYVTSDPEIIVRDVEQGLVSHATASIARGYPPEEVEIAKKEHAERLAEIAKSQTVGLGANAARGIKDAEGLDGKTERKAANMTETDPVVTDKTRGEGK